MIKRLFIIAFLMFSAGSFLFSETAVDRSDIVIMYNRSGWTLQQTKWDEDEWLISPNHTLDYDLHSTNRNSVGDEQYIIAPVLEENWGEMYTNQFTSNDNVSSEDAPDGGVGDTLGLFLTWDANWVYCAVNAEMRNQYSPGWDHGSGVNVIVLFDRVRDIGTADFSSRPSDNWKRALYTRNFEADLFMGAYGGGWGGVPDAGLGGAQLRGQSGPGDDSIETLIALFEPGNTAYENTNSFVASFNGAFEFNTSKRMLSFKISMAAFTNTLSDVSSITLKVMALTVDGDPGDSSQLVDVCPNNLAGMNEDRKTVCDNYFEIPFTDADGNVLMGVQPRYDAKIVYLPGSRPFSTPNIPVTMKTISDEVTNDRSIFVPTLSENLNLSYLVPKNTNLFDPSIKIYSLRGELVRVLKEGDSESTTDDWSSPKDSTVTKVFNWDGKDTYGDYVPMGSYIVISSALDEAYNPWLDKRVISIMH